ncbi:aspartate aminotransferase family protein [Rhodospirillum rubrum]|uniref:Aminotransferase n=3 Tax=Rhodospirillum rubrum TaxID=1085 RepID=Q2RPZ1_RHORT|nr:aminotransferase class III-fold pyridoxal phosphate-dependent enzyme [Rhodospirillum rubrum]ABC23804.1 aminotransferase [Rhodospirillum rubrum ATCC 11170]AEO49544.1 aminotransferase [Rhodospirillum rubrum F11]MBK5955480.1 aminotransferase [Rhodospirillum rubrum]QXG79752.1 aminotransferase class III-fold pyridoxal phosphate-dependent enzyme [Rhodospirillum rubrum]HAP98789.1 aminotransferase [Rhodospirillum rubrum]
MKQILALNAFDMSDAPTLSDSAQRLLAKRKALFGAASVLFYDKPLELVRAEGCWLFDEAGERYLDVYNNVPSVGHCHPHVVAAVADQLAKINTHTRYLNEAIHRYAERLVATLPPSLSNITFTCTGSESNDLALRLASHYSGGRGVIVTETAYHGNTAAVTEVSPSSARDHALAPHVRVVRAPDSYRVAPEALAARFAGDVAAAIADLADHGITLSALLVDSIFSSDGVYADPAGFLAEAVAVVHRHGGLFIADEVQPGFGRTGSALWGFQRHGVTPDIVTMGKPMGNGLPMGGVATRPEILDAFCAEVGYFNTFGGSPAAGAAGSAVLDVIEGEGLMANAEAVGAYLRESLGALAKRFPVIGDVRGAGLFDAVELVSDPEAKTPSPELASAIINGLRQRHVLIGAAGPFGNILKVRPPLCFTRDQVDILGAALEEVLTEIAP